MPFPTKTALAFLLMGSAAQAATITEDFSGGLNGWTHLTTTGAGGAGGTTGGAVVAIVPDGGPTGTGDAYIEYTEANSLWHHAIFGAGWTGDLSLYNGGMFSLDYVQTSGVGSPELASFGILRVSGAGTSATFDMVAAAPTGTWTTASLLFSASTFSVSESTWASILGNVTEIRFQTESVSGHEVIGLDNVSLVSPATVPLPAGGALLLAALGVLGLRRRR